MTGARPRHQAIVVGIDGSRSAQLALRWALAEAAVRACSVHLVHAWLMGAAGDFVWASRRDLRTDSQALLRTALAAAREHIDAPGEAVCRSVEGRPGPALVAAARDATLLVLGAPAARRGSHGPGSIGSHCARHLTIPIAVIPPEEPALLISHPARPPVRS